MNARLQELGLDPELLTAGAHGVSIDNMLAFCRIYNIPVKLYTTDDTSMEYHVKGSGPVTDNTLVALSHHGHAWLGVLSGEYPMSRLPADCHCGKCVALPAKHRKAKC